MIRSIRAVASTVSLVAGLALAVPGLAAATPAADAYLADLQSNCTSKAGNCYIEADFSSSNFFEAPSDDDVFGIRVAESISVVSSFVDYAWLKGSSGSTNPHTTNPYHGVAYYLPREKYSGMTVPVNKATLVLEIYKKAGNFCAYSKYGHDWSTTHLTGISVGTNSFGISWTSTSHKFAIDSQLYHGTTSC